MGRYDDLTVYTDPASLERLKGLHGYEIGDIKDGIATLTFPNIGRAAGWKNMVIEPVTLISEVKGFTHEVVVMVELTPHHTDLCNNCGGCQRNACETHRLCWCG
ncbi:hypothetical protein [Micromonospora sp. CB01531]|uniref:hypothetical protein n=1 Tax=Micromonospora sp. CB01531 TaxID=1718947 RepID=UPI000AFA817B|nr:hypothetical protein [Micromonospora sp. CB01531]